MCLYKILTKSNIPWTTSGPFRDIYTYGTDHSKTEPLDSVFEWIRFSSPHCTKLVEYLYLHYFMAALRQENLRAPGRIVYQRAPRVYFKKPSFQYELLESAFFYLASLQNKTVVTSQCVQLRFGDRGGLNWSPFCQTRRFVCLKKTNACIKKYKLADYKSPPQGSDKRVGS